MLFTNRRLRVVHAAMYESITADHQFPLPPENIYGHTKKLRFIMAQIENYRSSRTGPISVLDFGCGNGEAVSRFLIGNDVDYTGVDIHQPSLEHARRCFGSERAIFTDRVPEDKLFDVIVYADVIEHLPDPRQVLADHAKLLKEGGIVVGAVPNGYGPFENERRIDRLLHLTPALAAIVRVKRRWFGVRSGCIDELPYNSECGHVQFFTKRSLIRLLSSVGYHVMRFAHGAFLGAPFSEQTFLRPRFIVNANARIADILPHWMVSTWYFAACKGGDNV